MKPLVPTTPAVSTTPPEATPSELERDITRAIDQELAWYFGYAENAARLGILTLLPQYVIEAAAGESEEEQQCRAQALAQTVVLAVRALAPQHAGVLRAVYTPRRWPLAVAREFGPVTAVAVRLTCATNPWPVRSSHDGLEHAAAMDLARRIAREGEKARMRALRKTAGHLMGRAITAYVRARTKRVAT